MPDRETVIERLQRVSRYFKSLLKVGHDEDADIYRTIAKDLIDICTDFFETATKDADVIKSEGNKHTLTVSLERKVSPWQMKNTFPA